jgi:hypothetical protein
LVTNQDYLEIARKLAQCTDGPLNFARRVAIRAHGIKRNAHVPRLIPRLLLRPAWNDNTHRSGKPDAAVWDRRTSGSS